MLTDAVNLLESEEMANIIWNVGNIGKIFRHKIGIVTEEVGWQVSMDIAVSTEYYATCIIISSNPTQSFDGRASNVTIIRDRRVYQPGCIRDVKVVVCCLGDNLGKSKGGMRVSTGKQILQG